MRCYDFLQAAKAVEGTDVAVQAIEAKTWAQCVRNAINPFGARFGMPLAIARFVLGFCALARLCGGNKYQWLQQAHGQAEIQASRSG